MWTEQLMMHPPQGPRLPLSFEVLYICLTTGNLPTQMPCAACCGCSQASTDVHAHHARTPTLCALPSADSTAALSSVSLQFYTGPVFIDQPLVFEGGINLVPTGEPPSSSRILSPLRDSRGRLGLDGGRGSVLQQAGRHVHDVRPAPCLPAL